MPAYASSAAPPQKSSKVTVRTLQDMRSSNTPISMLTAYDYPTARILDQAGIDCLLVGDSLAMVVQGHETTLPVTLDQMIYHSEMVARAAERALVVVDLPFPEAQIGIERTIEASARILKETKATAVKIEGGAEQIERIEAVVAAGIPVMGHIGLQPQSALLEGGYRVQRDSERLITDARAVEAAGAFAVVIECVPADAARDITMAVRIPTIGIGAGTDVSGQVLVVNDLIGLTQGHVPKFVKAYANVRESMRSAAEDFHQEVQSKRFPTSEQSFK